LLYSPPNPHCPPNPPKAGNAGSAGNAGLYRVAFAQHQANTGDGVRIAFNAGSLRYLPAEKGK
jgi:hypothetical protein